MNIDDEKQLLIDNLQLYEENLFIEELYSRINQRIINENNIFSFNNDDDAPLINALTDYQNYERAQRRQRRAELRDVQIAFEQDVMDQSQPLLETIREENEEENQMEGGALPYRQIRVFNRVKNAKFGIEEKNIEYESVVDEHASYESMIESLLAFVNNIVTNEIHPLGSDKRVRLIINHDSFDGAINFNYLFADQITTDLIWSEFEKTSQSRKAKFGDMVPHQKLYITIQTIDMIAGGSKLKNKLPIKKARSPAKVKYDANRIRSKKLIAKYNIEAVLAADFTKPNAFSKILANKTCIIKIFNNNNSCLIEAIVHTIQRYEIKKLKELNQKKPSKQYLDKIVEFENNLLPEKFKVLVAKTAKRFNINPNKKSDLKEVARIQNLIPEYQICILGQYTQSIDQFLFLDRTNVYHKFLYIIYDHNHFYPIDSITAYYEKSYYCDYCKQQYQVKINHKKCKNSCKSCLRRSINCPVEQIIICDRMKELKKQCCNQSRSLDCHELHLQLTCQFVLKCPVCFGVIVKNKRHVCLNKKICKTCDKIVNYDHKCYMQTQDQLDEIKNKKIINAQKTLDKIAKYEKTINDVIIKHRFAYITDENKRKALESHADGIALAKQQHQQQQRKQHQQEREEIKKNKQNSFVFFDFETYICPDTSNHIVNLAMAKKICEKCVNILIEENRCNDCQKIHIFENIDEYCEWALNQTNTIQIAHNMQGYDGIFLLENFINNLLPSDPSNGPVSIHNGLKILCIRWKKIKIIDSFSFLRMALSNFPKTFNITGEKKGFFPHTFNTLANQNYIGDYPPPEAYEPNLMMPKQKKEFDLWYESVRNESFDFKKEFYAYCASDVRILTEGCLRYRFNSILSTSTDKFPGLDPFDNITIASYTNAVFRRDHLEKNTIAIIPKLGYNAAQKVSEKAMLWLKLYSEKNNVFVQHAKNIGEKKCGQFFLDGFVDCVKSNGKKVKVILEFNGCRFHCCPICFDSRLFNHFKNETNIATFNRHCERKKFITQCFPDFDYIEMYEHVWDDLVKSDTETSSFVKNNQHLIQNTIKPRDALYGGRTNAFRLFHKCKESEAIYFVDAKSLYPTVQLYDRFPVGHPEIYFENFNYTLNFYFGLIKCEVVPPRYLYIPCLPNRINNKLMFTLCRSCAEINNQTDQCIHNDDDRKISGTYVSPELYQAVHDGYKIKKIYHVWHFKESSQYNKLTQSGGIFTSFQKKCMRAKAEASGFPPKWQTRQQRMAYLESFWTQDGIRLDYDRVEFNEFLRAINKTLANSMWGYLAKCTDRIENKLIRNQSDLITMLEQDSKYIITDVNVFESNINTCQVFYKINEDDREDESKTNVVLAAFVTAYGRLRLYEQLKKLNKQVLYCDTDSIMYLVSRDDDYRPKEDDNLGGWVSELKPGVTIREMGSVGPKSLYTKDSEGLTDVTFKGITQNVATTKVLTADSIKNLILNKSSEKITTPQRKFVTDKKTWTIKTEMIEKKCGLTYNKRIILDDMNTIPFGYDRNLL